MQFFFLVASSILCVFSFFNLLGIDKVLALAQLVNFIGAWFIFVVLRLVGRSFFTLNICRIYWFCVALLLGTLIFGVQVKGARRWIDIWFLHIQPSELFRAFFILYFANFLSRKDISMLSFIQFIKMVIVASIPILFIFLQPDLATAGVYLIIFAGMILFSSVPKRYIMYSSIIFILLLPMGWMSLKGYQKDRIRSFIAPHKDVQGRSYNMTQAVITVGAGGFLGKGLGYGTQSNLDFLPENHTDFAFSSLIEQFGLMGGMALISLFGVICSVLIYKLWNITSKGVLFMQTEFLYTLGFLIFILTHLCVNIGMNMGVVPVAGITLPLVSYGGSAVLSWFIMSALLFDPRY